MSNAADVWVLVEVWLSPHWTFYTSGKLADVRYELDALTPADLTTITALPPGGQLDVIQAGQRRRITRVDGWTIPCPAWQLLGDWSFAVDNTHEIVLPGGHVAYHSAAASRDNRQVCLSRLQPLPNLRLRVVRRYVGADAPVVLRPIVR